jgi:predicted Zn-dependent protease
MLEGFTCVYYDGLTAAGRDAIVTFNPTHFVITYFKSDGIETSKFWEIEKINKQEFGIATKLGFAYQSEPAECIEIIDIKALDSIFVAYANTHLSKEKLDVKLGKKLPLLIAFLIGIVALVILFYWYGLPKLADTVAMRIPIETEREFGTRILNSFITQEAIKSEDSEDLQAFFDSLHFDSSHTVKLHLINSNVVNAFALPGGHILVYQGIIDKIEKPEQLAALLGHEYSHIKLRHSMRSMVKGMASGALLSLVIGDASGLMGGLVQNADEFRQLNYSREFEKESDDNGMELMYQNNYDLNGMVGLMQVLQTEEKKLNKTGIRIPEFLSSHPLTNERIENAKQYLKFHPQNNFNCNLINLFEKIKN